MPQWLTRDPLNGLVVTLTFFISMTIGRYLREKKISIQYKNTDSRIKILISFFLIIAVTFMKHWYFPIVVSALCILISLKIKLIRDYSKKLVFPLVLALFIFTVQSFTYGVNTVDLGIISVYAEGLDYGFLIFARVFASASVLILLILTTSRSDLFESMRYFGVPGTMLEISSFMTRYINTFSREGRKLRLAQESRCGLARKGFTNRMHDIASICGLLVTRAFSRSEEVYRAMISRAWKPELHYSMDIPPLNRRDTILGVILSSGIIALVVLDRFL